VIAKYLLAPPWSVFGVLRDDGATCLFFNPILPKTLSKVNAGQGGFLAFQDFNPYIFLPLP